MANKKSFDAWCMQYKNGSLYQKVFLTKRELINDWVTDMYPWKYLRKLGYRAVKVEVKIIER